MAQHDESPNPPILPKKTQILQCQPSATSDVLYIYHLKRPHIQTDMLGRKFDKTGQYNRIDKLIRKPSGVIGKRLECIKTMYHEQTIQSDGHFTG